RQAPLHLLLSSVEQFLGQCQKLHQLRLLLYDLAQKDSSSITFKLASSPLKKTISREICRFSCDLITFEAHCSEQETFLQILEVFLLRLTQHVYVDMVHSYFLAQVIHLFRQMNLLPISQEHTLFFLLKLALDRIKPSLSRPANGG